jgi:hypothetical protein
LFNVEPGGTYSDHCAVHIVTQIFDSLVIIYSQVFVYAENVSRLAMFVSVLLLNYSGLVVRH